MIPQGSKRINYWNVSNAHVVTVTRKSHGIIEVRYVDPEGALRYKTMTMQTFRAITEVGVYCYFSHIKHDLRKRTHIKRTLWQRIKIAWRVITNG
jgi:hypothetical protein